MGKQESPYVSSDILIFSQIYRTFKEILKSHQSQIETLINDREFLENKLYIQQEHWNNRARFLESCIAQMKAEQAKTRLVEDAKMDALVGFKESEALCYKMQLELAKSDLEEFRSCVEVISAEMGGLKEKLKVLAASEVMNTIDHSGSSENFKGGNQLTMSLKKEINKLKHAYRELSLRRDTEDCQVRNQFRKMESDIALLKSKHTEADHQAREAAEKLQDSVEKLQQEINKKDEIIVKLEAVLSILMLDVSKHAEEAEQDNNKMKKFHADMDELCLAAMEKEKLIVNLRKELRNFNTDLKTNMFEKSIFSMKIKSEGKSKNPSTSIRQIHFQRCSKKRNLESRGHIHQKLTNKR